MKFNLLLLLLLCAYLNVTAQFAIVDDKDGFVNIRKDKSTGSAIIKRLSNNSIVRIWDEKPENIDWLHIYFQTNYANGFEGYIHKSRVKFISDFKPIKNITYQINACSAQNDSINISISSSRFIVESHRIKYHKQINNEGSYYESIDGKPIWGTDGELPKRVISKLLIKINGNDIVIPASAFNDLYEPRLSTLQVYISPNNTIYVQLDYSDGAGAYSIIWTIENKIFTGRHIDRGI